MPSWGSHSLQPLRVEQAGSPRCSSFRHAITSLLLCGLVASADAQEFPVTALTVGAGNQIALSWPSDSNHWYRAEKTTNLATGPWEILFPTADATPPVNIYTDSVCSAACGFYRVVASTADWSHTDFGTTNDVEQITFGTDQRDRIVQFGGDGNDLQYAETGDADDWIEQYGGSGDDNQNAIGGSANDFIYQDGGEGNDTQYAEGTTGKDSILQEGGPGDDRMTANPGEGNDFIVQRGGPGNDKIRADGGEGDDTITIEGGPGDDTIGYDVWSGHDAVSVDGGEGDDTLFVNEDGRHGLVIQRFDGGVLYTNGLPETVIRVLALEHIYALDGIVAGKTNRVGSAP